MTPKTQRVQFAGHSGATLAARLDLPNGQTRAYALFAHCFTCSKDRAAARTPAQPKAMENELLREARASCNVLQWLAA